MKTVTRADLAATVHESVFGVSRQECRDLVDQVIDAISGELVAGQPVKISRFGAFMPIRTKTRDNGRNPKSAEDGWIHIPSRVRVAFRYSAGLVAELNPGRKSSRGAAGRKK